MTDWHSSEIGVRQMETDLGEGRRLARGKTLGRRGRRGGQVDRLVGAARLWLGLERRWDARTLPGLRLAAECGACKSPQPHKTQKRERMRTRTKERARRGHA